MNTLKLIGTCVSVVNVPEGTLIVRNIVTFITNCLCSVAFLFSCIYVYISVICVFMLIVPFFMLNTITLVTAAAKFPHRDQYIFIGSHVVFGYLIQNQTPRWTREKELWLWLIHCFGFSCFLCNKNPWSFWAEPSASTHTEVVISALGFDHNVNRYISHS